ncbi:MAG: DUF4168 domain-containing protein [Moorea sp. SIO2B7]|nr:DUF4168 domain-containing protein [Moorena sp. SIO2B7]
MNKILTQVLITGSITAINILSGVIPGLSLQSSGLNFNIATYAQEKISQGDVEKYATVVLLMEPLRQETYNEIKKRIDSDQVPNVVCWQEDSFRNLDNAQLRDIAAGYCNRAKEIVQSNGMTVEQFNEITRNAKPNSPLATQIRDTLIRMQQPQQ